MFALVLCLIGGGLVASPQDRPPPANPQPQDLGSISLDALIERLPFVGDEWMPRERSNSKWRLRPSAAEVKRRLLTGASLSREQWERALLRTGALRVRGKWPVEQPFAISMRRAEWLGVSRIRMDAISHDLAPAEVGLLYRSTCGTYMGWKTQDWLHQVLGPLAVGRHTVLFDVEIERGEDSFLKDALEPRPGTLWRGRLAFEVEVVESVDQAIPPVHSLAIDQALRDSLSLAFDEWPKGPVSILVLDPDVENGSLLASLGLSLEVELLREGEVIDRFPFIAHTYDRVASSNTVNGSSNQPFAFRTCDSIPPHLEGDARFQRGWSIRVRGTSERVWILWEASKRWSGEIEIPLSDLIQRERDVAPGGRGAWCWTPTRR